MKKSDLTILVLTFDLTQEIRPARYLPKVCHKVFQKTMIEIVIENCLHLNPSSKWFIQTHSVPFIQYGASFIKNESSYFLEILSNTTRGTANPFLINSCNGCNDVVGGEGSFFINKDVFNDLINKLRKFSLFTHLTCFVIFVFY